MMRAAEIAQSIGASWPAILEQLGIAPNFLVNRHGPCPACGGTDRYRFDNRHLRGDFYCNGCGAGDGFALLQRVHGWDFPTTRQRVIQAAGISSTGGLAQRSVAARIPSTWSTAAQASPPARVTRLRSERCDLCDCEDAVRYFDSRKLWPAAAQSTLKAHAGIDYYDEGKKTGRFPGLVAEVRDSDGELVTTHVTYLANGRKLTDRTPRKLLSPLTGRESCAVRLYRISGDVMGIGEGIETCIAASTIHQLPVWSALNTSLLAKFTPPTGVQTLQIFADRDVAGLEAALKLMERLKGKVHCEIRSPTAPAKDWADVLKPAQCR